MRRIAFNISLFSKTFKAAFLLFGPHSQTILFLTGGEYICSMPQSRSFKLITGFLCLVCAVCLFALGRRAATAVAVVLGLATAAAGVWILFQTEGRFIGVVCIVLGAAMLLLAAFFSKAALVVAGISGVILAFYIFEYEGLGIKCCLHAATGLVMVLQPFFLSGLFAYLLAVLLLLQAVNCCVGLFYDDFY